MHATAEPALSEYNARVLDCQEDAFTMAYYALGDDSQAEQVVQAAVNQAFWYFDGSEVRCREQILSAVAGGCRRSAARRSAAEGVFSTLPIEERLAVILVDVLTLSYRQAAEILRCPEAQFTRLLAQGRCRMMNETTDSVVKK
jgi:DNA-directed RNA polymerase specialized sigma24 family protein